MTANDWIQTHRCTSSCSWPWRSRSGASWRGCCRGERTWLTRLGRPLERALYRLAGVAEDDEMTWTALRHRVARVQRRVVRRGLPAAAAAGVPPGESCRGSRGVSPALAFNTAVSFATNTNWQAYGGETTMSYLTQALALGVQNFVSAAAGIAVVVALIRGFARAEKGTIGNFWVDLTRTTLYILLPLSLV